MQKTYQMSTIIAESTELRAVERSDGTIAVGFPPDASEYAFYYMNKLEKFIKSWVKSKYPYEIIPLFKSRKLSDGNTYLIETHSKLKDCVVKGI